ncbi:MAG TPA: hypothetical protein VGH67_19110 [Solirubrobacteraceae bacterium]
MDEVKGVGRSIFAATLLLIGCVLNVIYGIAAISNSHFFTQNSHYVFGNLKTWGWVTLIIGVLEGFAGVSLFQGGAFGRWIAVAAASLAAIGALLDLPAAPFWSLAIFALSLWIIHGLLMYGETDPDRGDDYPVAESMPRERVAGRS